MPAKAAPKVVSATITLVRKVPTSREYDQIEAHYTAEISNPPQDMSLYWDQAWQEVKSQIPQWIYPFNPEDYVIMKGEQNVRNFNQDDSWRDVYTSDYLSAKQLKEDNAQLTLTIQDVGLDEIYNPSSNEKEQKIVFTFVGSDKKLITGSTICASMEQITGSDHPANWKGQKIVVYPGTYNKRLALQVRAANETAAKAEPPPKTNGQPKPNGRPRTPDDTREWLQAKALSYDEGGQAEPEADHIEAIETILVNNLDLTLDSLSNIMIAGQFCDQIWATCQGHVNKLNKGQIAALLAWIAPGQKLNKKASPDQMAIQEGKLMLQKWGISTDPPAAEEAPAPAVTKEDEIPF